MSNDFEPTDEQLKFIREKLDNSLKQFSKDWNQFNYKINMDGLGVLKTVLILKMLEEEYKVIKSNLPKEEFKSIEEIAEKLKNQFQTISIIKKNGNP